MSQEMLGMQEKDVKEVETVKFKTKSQVIYFMDENSQLGRFYHVDNERLKITDAEKILKDNEVPFQTLLRVLSESVVLEMPRTAFDSYIVATQSK